jgi:hypothetical protein
MGAKMAVSEACAALPDFADECATCSGTSMVRVGELWEAGHSRRASCRGFVGNTTFAHGRTTISLVLRWLNAASHVLPEVSQIEPCQAQGLAGLCWPRTNKVALVLPQTQDECPDPLMTLATICRQTENGQVPGLD